MRTETRQAHGKAKQASREETTELAPVDVGLRQEIAERTGAQVGWTEANRMLAAFLDHTHKKLVELEQADGKAKGPWEKEGENEDDRPRT